MKLLADTSVWSLALRRKSASSLNHEERHKVAIFTEAIAKGQVAMFGPIRQELLSGIREIAQFEKLKRSLGEYQDEPVLTEDYEEAARLHNMCRRLGVQCGPIDILICAVAIRRNWEVLSSDRGLDRCLETVRQALKSKTSP